MNLNKRLGRLEEQVRLQQPDPLPELLQELLPQLEHLPPEARDRVLHKEWARVELLMGFIGHVMPGVFAMVLTPEEIERAAQVMLDVYYPDLPSPRDVDPGDIEEVVRQKRNADQRELYEKRKRFGHENAYGSADLLKPETGDLLKEEAKSWRHCFGNWEMTVPWIDLSGSYDRERQRTGARHTRGQRR